jgi:hypothetical protein
MILYLIISMNGLNVVNDWHPVPDHVCCGGDILINLYNTSDVCEVLGSFKMELTAVFIVVGKCEGKPDATFSFADDDFMAVSSGSINPQMAFVRYIEGTSVFH